jgi:hypothetical protein
MRHTIMACLICLLLAGCQRAPTYQQPPAHIPQARLIYTSNALGENWLGVADGVSSAILYHSMDICRRQRPRELGDIQQVSVDQRESSVVIPATGQLVVEAVWTSSEGGCLTSQRVFSPKAGVNYRLENNVDLQSGVCSMRLLKQDAASGDFHPTQVLVEPETYCAGKTPSALPF